MDKFIFIFMLLIPCGLFAQDISTVLSKLPICEQRALEELFHVLLDDDQFSYTLFGDKPVSLSGDYTITPYELTLSGIPCGGIFWAKWAIWKKVTKDLSIKKYVFIDEPAYNRHDEAMRFIFFINKKYFLDMVDRHLQLFKNILGNDITAIKLLEKMEKEHAFMRHLKSSEVLLGILLGYGENNAKLYARRMNLRKFISAKSLPILPEKEPSPSQGFISIEEEENYLSQQLQSFSLDDGVLWMIPSAQFAVDPNHEETKLLQKKYAYWRNTISRRYAESNNFLELVISKLTED